MFITPFKRVEDEPVVRFETAPGEQMQADFTVVRRGRDPLLAFVATLGYSRASFVRFTTDETAETLCALRARGADLLRRRAAPRAVRQRQDSRRRARCLRRRAAPLACALRALADEFGFSLRLCRPYRAKTKGKVERFNGYLKGSFLVPLAATLKSRG